MARFRWEWVSKLLILIFSNPKTSIFFEIGWGESWEKISYWEWDKLSSGNCFSPIFSSSSFHLNIINFSVYSFTRFLPCEVGLPLSFFFPSFHLDSARLHPSTAWLLSAHVTLGCLWIIITRIIINHITIVTINTSNIHIIIIIPSSSGIALTPWGWENE